MDRLYPGYPTDAEVDNLLSQLTDENLLKLKSNTHHISNGGFEYPFFTDAWTNADDDAATAAAAAAGALDTQLTSRFSNLKLPITPAKKKGKDSQAVAKKGGDSQPTVVGKKGRDSEGEESGRSSRSSFRREDGSTSKRQQQQQQKREMVSKGPLQRAESPSFRRRRSWDDPAAAAEDDDPDNIDALLNERFLALKAALPPVPSPSPSRTPSSRNLGLDNLFQFSRQLSSKNYEAYGHGSSPSIPSSPSANLLGRSQSRSSPRVMTTSVSSSSLCSAPSPLKLLKQVSAKNFPFKQQQEQSSSATLPPSSLAPRSPSEITDVDTTPVKKAGREFKVEGFGNDKPVDKKSAKKEKKEKKSSREERNKDTSPSTGGEYRVEGFGNYEAMVKESKKKDRKVKKSSSSREEKNEENSPSRVTGREYKVEGFGNSKPVSKKSEKRKEKKEKKEKNDSNEEKINSTLSTVKDVRRLLSSVADRVGFEKSRVSSAEGDDFLGEDLHGWSVLVGEEDFDRASTEERKVNREADRVVEWAKDEARLGAHDSDVESEGDDLEPREVDDDLDSGGSSSSSSERPPKKEKPQKKKVVKAAAPKQKKKWGLF